MGTLLDNKEGIYFRELFSPGPWTSLTGNVYDIQVNKQNTQMTVIGNKQAAVIKRNSNDKKYTYTVELNPSLVNLPNNWVNITGCLIPQ